MPFDPPADLSYEVRAALSEDIGDGDITAALVYEKRQATAQVIARENAILCGRPWFDAVYRELDDGIEIEWLAQDGDRVQRDQVLCRLQGSSQAMLTGERTALNFLQLLSATATRTGEFVNAVKATRCRILDTRKTIPGLRLAQKYAVRCGGGTNHRLGLYDAVLIKENHILAAGGVDPAVTRARGSVDTVMIQVEVENLRELRQGLDANPDRLLLDNFGLDRLRRAVAIRDAHENRYILLEASGGVALRRVGGIAATGVDFVSVGSLTKDIQAIDLSMRFV